MKNLKWIAVMIITAVAAVLLILQYQTNAKLREENRALREQTAQLGELDRLRAENEQLAGSQSKSNQDQFLELLRLRGEVGLLRKQLAELTKARKAETKATQSQTTEDAEEAAKDEQKRIGIAKMNHAKHWLMAFLMFANQNNNQLPADFPQAQALLPENNRDEVMQAAQQFDVVYQGPLSAITNPPPSHTIILREKQPWQTFDGKWAKTYGFADGHAEIHSEPDGNFEKWESERMQRVGQ